MNFEQVAASLYVALSKWQVAAVFCGLMSICWLRLLVPFLSSTSPSAMEGYPSLLRRSRQSWRQQHHHKTRDQPHGHLQ